MAQLDDLFDAGARAVAAAVVEGGVALGELAAAALERAAAAPRGALLQVSEEAVTEQVAALRSRLEAGERPALAGVPVAHKDLFDTARFPTTYGNATFGGRPSSDAVAVARTVEAGVLQVGKANLNEVAYGVTGRNEWLGDCEHPTVDGHMPGGSSAGSGAAVAAGAVVASLGTDTGGSVRIPAALCGCVGLKTTLGAVPRTGVLPLSWLQDTVGPLARSADDAGLLLGVVGGSDGEDPHCRRPRSAWTTDPVEPLDPAVDGLVVVVAAELWERRIHPEVASACRSAVERLERAGAEVREVRLPGFQAARHAQGTLLGAHAWAVHHERFAADPMAFGDAVRARLEANRHIGTLEVVEALRQRERWIAEVETVLPDDGVVASATVAFASPRMEQDLVVWDDGEEDVTPALTRLTGIWNLTGFPAVSVPVGTSRDGLPIGLQLAGRPWSELLLLRTAATLEAT